MEIAIDGPGAFAVDVVGVSQYQRVLEAAAEEGAIVEAVLVLEDTNAYDDQAVAVHIDGQRAGYLSRANARLYRADLAAAGAERATVRSKPRSSAASKPNPASARTLLSLICPSAVETVMTAVSASPRSRAVSMSEPDR